MGRGLGVAAFLAAVMGMTDARGQQGGAAPGSGGSALGPAPGSGGPGTGDTPGSESILGGRAGPGFPRVPQGITRPGQEFGTEPRPGVGLPAALPAAELPIFGPLELPATAEPEGPPHGLTLDQAIERLVRTNVELRAKAVEIPKAEADILTASLRLNPIFYADVQQVPYGSYSDERPGGPTQYDVNLTLPLDVTGKRRARTEVACRARRVIEAQYQDAVRLQIDNLYTAFIDMLAARETVRYAEASGAGLRRVLALTESLREKGAGTEADVDRIAVQLDAAELALLEAEETLRDARRTLAVLLAVPAAQAGGLELRGSLRDGTSAPPPVEQLVPVALATRPDLAAYRLGIQRAHADVRLAEANRMENLFLLVQPYTFQDLSPFDAKSAHSWALGVTVPLPLFNRNQGNIQRARLNVSQTELQLRELELRVVAEIERAERAYAVTRRSVERLEGETIPKARRTLGTALELFESGEQGQVVYLNALRDYNDIVRQYRDTLVRQRRAMLRLNTAVGRRILP
jgi:cobalt-zinc-cadmium efflux system outer membrane protein